jgi:hypothetical protein
MQSISKICLSALLTVLFSTSARASTMTFTATRVLEVSDRHAPADKLLRAPVRVNTELKQLLIPRIAPCVAEYCNEQVQFTKFQLVKFQKIGSTVTLAQAKGTLKLENGNNSAQIEIVGNTDQTGRMTITTTSADGMYQSQATLEGYFTQTAF